MPIEDLISPITKKPSSEASRVLADHVAFLKAYSLEDKAHLRYRRKDTREKEISKSLKGISSQPSYAGRAFVLHLFFSFLLPLCPHIDPPFDPLGYFYQ